MGGQPGLLRAEPGPATDQKVLDVSAAVHGLDARTHSAGEPGPVSTRITRYFLDDVGDRLIGRSPIHAPESCALPVSRTLTSPRPWARCCIRSWPLPSCWSRSWRERRHAAIRHPLTRWPRRSDGRRVSHLLQPTPLGGPRHSCPSRVFRLTLFTGDCLDPAELEPHDRALRTRPFHAAKSQIFEHLLPAEERISRPPIGSCERPAFNGNGTFAAGKFDRRAHECVGNPLGSVAGPDE
jgi:hypothetical protein